MHGQNHIKFAELSLGFTHQPQWIVTKNEVGFMQVFKQDKMCAESYQNPYDADRSGH